MDRLAVIARLRPGRADEARRLISEGPPFELAALRMQRHAIYVSSDEVVFVFEGPEVGWTVEDLVNDPVISAAFSGWGPLIEGTPRMAREAFSWSRDEAATPPHEPDTRE